MKKLLFVLSAFTLSFSAFAENYKSIENKATEAFQKALETTDRPEIQKVMTELKQGNFQQGSTQALLLSSSCGFAGCNSTYLVTTSFSTHEINEQTTVLAGLAEAGTSLPGKVKRLYTGGELLHLLKK